MIIAREVDIPEVIIFFNNKLLRGNRSSKVDNWGTVAFKCRWIPRARCLFTTLLCKCTQGSPRSSRPITHHWVHSVSTFTWSIALSPISREVRTCPQFLGSQTYHQTANSNAGRFRVWKELNTRIAVLHLVPGFDAKVPLLVVLQRRKCVGPHCCTLPAGG